MKRFLPLLLVFLVSCHAVPSHVNKDPEMSVVKTPTVSKSQEFELPQTHNQFESRALQTQKSQEKKTKVALLLPFSGKHRDLGWSLFNSATMSVFDNDHNHAIELVLFDSKESAKETEEAFDEIVKREDIKVVIGPVFSQSLPLINKKAKRAKIAVISLSNNQESAERISYEGGVFVSGILPETQVDRVVEYSLDSGRNNFVVIAPSTQYGRTMSTLFGRVVRNRDGNVISSEYYDSNGMNIDKIVERAITSFSVFGDLAEAKKSKKEVVADNSNRAYPQVIFIPDTGRNLARVVSAIKNLNKDERDFQIVGTSQWDDSAVMSDPNMFGAWFAAPDNTRFRNFERSYQQNFGKAPPRISSLAYDLTAAVIELSNQVGRSKAPTVADFVNYQNPPINGFDGIDGSFRFLPNGLVQRNLAVLQVGSGKFDTVDSPAMKFLKY